MATISQYLTETRDLLRDSNAQFFSDQQVTRYINSSRAQIAKITACIQILIPGQSPFGSASQPGLSIPSAMVPGMLPGNIAGGFNASGANSTTSNTFQTITGVEMYPFKYGNAYAQAANGGVKSIIDVQDVAVSQGGERPAMTWIPFADLQAYARSYNLGVSSYPFYWSTFGDGENGQVWLFPFPSISSEMEWLVSCVPKPLYSNDGPEAIPDNFTDAVKFFAAYLGYLNSQRTGQASLMLNYFNDFLSLDRASSDRGKVSVYYDW